MANTDEGKEEKKEPLDDFSLAVPRERVESLWRQVLTQRSTGRSDLAAARASRSKAELERRRIYHEALEATKEASEQLIAEAERQLERAKKAEAESDKKRAKVEEELKQAQLARAESDSYREKSVAEADSYCAKVIAEADSYREKVATEAQQESQLEAQRIREEARAAALQECNELKRHVTNEVQAILDEIEAIRGAAEEELEAQRIYAETANIKAMTHDVRTNVVESVEAVFGQDRALAEDSPSVDMEEPVVEAQAARPRGPGEWVIGAGGRDVDGKKFQVEKLQVSR